MGNSKKITKHVGGRPTKLTNEVVEKLESILKIGGTVEESCSYAGINKTSYYSWLKADESFSTKMEAAQHFSDVAAKNVVVDQIVKHKDVATSKWWLEKREFKQGPQVAVAGKNVQVFMPEDTLGKYQTDRTSDEDME